MFENICNSCNAFNNCLNNYNKNTRCNVKRKNISIINSILIDEVIVNPESAIPFNANRIYISDDIIRIDNTNFKICTSGLYKVTFTTNARLYIGETNEKISLAISINGVLIPGTIAKKICVQNEIVNLNTQAVFCIAEGTNAILNIVNVNVDAPIIVCDNANIIIEKIS